MRKGGAADYYGKRIKELRRENRRKSRRTPYVRIFAEECRGYEEYNSLFSIGLGCSIIDALAGLGRKKLCIVDDGAGKGRFLAELKPKLKERGIESETIALSISRRLSLWLKKRQGVIDQAFLRRAEKFSPEKKADAIFSFYGSISYVEDLVRKEQLLKFVHSLRKGGIMMVGFHLVEAEGKSRVGVIVGGLSRNPNSPRVMTPEMEMRGIERALEKRGFKAKFIPSNLSDEKQYPNWMLILKRIK